MGHCRSRKFRSIINSYYRNTCATILTYNITNRSTFENLTRWLNDIKNFNNCRHDFVHPILLLGTCKDLENKRKVNYEEGLQFSMRYPEMIFREVNSFVKKGAMEESYYELLKTVYYRIENERKKIISNIPVGKPINNVINLKHNSYNKLVDLTNINDLITCKGVKYMTNNFEIESLTFHSHDEEKEYSNSKYCGRCNS